MRKFFDAFLPIAITLLVVAICMFFSMRYLTFRMAPMSEEAGFARWGFPAIMAESPEVFYAGWGGVPAREGGSNYIRKNLGRDWPRQDELLWDGILINLSCFLIFGMIIAAILTNRFMKNFLMVMRFISPERKW
jgi:hypothetical protein